MTTSKDNKHPHYDVIIKWAENPIENIVQFRNSPHLPWQEYPIKNCTPGFLASSFYRIKPKTIKYKYRKALMGRLSENTRVFIVSSEEHGNTISKTVGFIKWISDWIEEEIEI